VQKLELFTPKFGEIKKITVSDRMLDLTPNFKGIFKGMLVEAVRKADAEEMFSDLKMSEQASDLRQVQNWLAPFNAALHAASSVEEIEDLRRALAQIVAGVDDVAARIENDLAEGREDSE
jgi:hypothetical protein